MVFVTIEFDNHSAAVKAMDKMWRKGFYGELDLQPAGSKWLLHVSSERRWRSWEAFGGRVLSSTDEDKPLHDTQP